MPLAATGAHSMGLEGRYRIIKKVADGGMAEIFLATQTGAQGFARTVILKQILPAFSLDPKFRNMMVDEAHIAMSLNHSNIVQVLDLGESNRRYFLVLELVDGWDLATVRLRAEAAGLPLPIGLALYTVAQVSRALAYAHGKTKDGKPLAIVHRDISPQNVLLSEQGEVKLTDFGIAKALGKRERTLTGVIKGKLDFMSPEQAAGAPLDARSDVFSLGTLLYLLATDRRPFDGGSDLETLIRIQNAQFRPPAEVNPRIDPKVATIIEKAMQKLPSQRYKTADEMMRALEEVLRSDFPLAGQSELKRYLDELGRRDRSPPISRARELPMEPVEEDTEPQEKPTPDMRAAAQAGTLAFAATRLGTPVDLGARADDSTANVFPPDRGGRGLSRVLIAAVSLAALVGAAIHFGAGQKARRWAAEGRERLVKTGLLAKRETATRSTESAATRRRDLPAAGSTPNEAKSAESPRGEGRPRSAATPSPAAQEPRPAEPGPSLVTVAINSRPVGATIRNAKGAVLGRTPLSLSLRPGTTQRWTLSKRGYAQKPHKMVVPRSNDSVLVKLTRAGRRSRR